MTAKPNEPIRTHSVVFDFGGEFVAPVGDLYGFSSMHASGLVARRLWLGPMGLLIESPLCHRSVGAHPFRQGDRRFGQVLCLGLAAVGDGAGGVRDDGRAVGGSEEDLVG